MTEQIKLDELLNNSEQSNYQRIYNVLQLNDDCLLEILRYLSLVDLCGVSETCKHLQRVAREEFLRQKKAYEIPQNAVKFEDHPRILRNFGHLIHEATIIKLFFVSSMTPKKVVRAFNLLDRYCSDTLEQLTIIATHYEIALPPSAQRLMTKMKRIILYAQFSHKTSRTMLADCRKLVELNMVAYDGPFVFTNHRFPHLLKLMQRVRVNNYDIEFKQMKTFFKNHPKLITLHTQFLMNDCADYIIDLSFIAYLLDLEEFHFIINGAEVIGIDAFVNLKKVKRFTIDSSNDASKNAAILESLGSVDSLVKVAFGFSEINHMIAGIARFKNLSEFTISHDMLQSAVRQELNTNISCLAQLKNSRLSVLNIECNKLLEPETIVDVIRNLKEVKVLKCFCEIELTESICKRLAAVCSSQRRKIEIILCEDIIFNGDFDFSFIDNFNKEHGTFVQIKQEE